MAYRRTLKILSVLVAILGLSMFGFGSIAVLCNMPMYDDLPPSSQTSVIEFIWTGLVVFLFGAAAFTVFETEND